MEVNDPEEKKDFLLRKMTPFSFSQIATNLTTLIVPWEGAWIVKSS